MIIYGTKGRLLNTERVSGIKCRYCNEQSRHTITIFGRYFYLYWIPIFPLNKKGVSECNHCKATFERKEMSDSLKMAFDNVKRNTKTPITYWIGTLFIICLISFGVYSIKKHKTDVVKFIAQPEKGDIIKYKSSPSNYSTLKITNVINDSIYVVANSMEISRRSKIYKIDKNKNYTAERYGMSLKDYKKAFEEKKFIDVDR